MKYNTIIIGAGISGISAAIYLKRANIDVLIIEKSAPGGQLLRTSAIENYPATTPQIEGATLAMNLYEQVQHLEIPIDFDEVVKIETTESKNIVITKNNNYECKNVIIATGRNYKKLNVENEDKFTGRGISYCAICDGALYKNKNVAVIGAGDAAFKEALYLSNLCNKVTIIARRDEFRASKTLVNNVKEKKNVEILTNRTVINFEGKDNLEFITIKDVNTEKIEKINISGCFIYIGQIPESRFLEELNLQEEEGYIITDEHMKTNKHNIYACGDIRKKEVYQLVTATYDGVIAAEQIINKK